MLGRQKERNLFLLDSLVVLCSNFLFALLSLMALSPRPAPLLPHLCVFSNPSSPPIQASFNDPTLFTEDSTRECHTQPCSVEAGYLRLLGSVLESAYTSNDLTILLSPLQVRVNPFDLLCEGVGWVVYGTGSHQVGAVFRYMRRGPALPLPVW